MFAASRKTTLDSIQWRKEGGDVDFVEAWHDINSSSSPAEFHHGSLTDDEILEWVKDKNWTPPGYSKPSLSNFTSRIRIIICERTQYNPPDFQLSEEIFEEVEAAFNLHPATLPTFERHCGAFSRYLTFCDKDRSKLKRISDILKVPQKREIANYGLSISHDIDTRTTTALLFGAEVLIRDTKFLMNQYKNYYEPAIVLPSLIEILRSSPHAWGHPLFLPTALLEHHMHRIRGFTAYGNIVHETVRIETELGVTQVGRPKNRRYTPFKNETVRDRVKALTVRINTHSTRLIFTLRSPTWNLKCSESLLKLATDLERHLPGLTHDGVHEELKTLVQHNVALAEGAVSDVENIRERLALQLNVLYNLVAQMDNALNAQLAAASGRDSTSMKILAFISAIFLPGSFVAGVFSMSMFDWQYNDGPTKGQGEPGEGGRVVSSRFWVYWAITIPLTLVTVLGWGLWWLVEMRRFKETFKHINTYSGRSPILID